MAYRKIIILIIVLALCLFLAGCVAKGNAASNTTNDNQEESADGDDCMMESSDDFSDMSQTLDGWLSGELTLHSLLQGTGPDYIIFDGKVNGTPLIAHGERYDRPYKGDSKLTFSLEGNEASFSLTACTGDQCVDDQSLWNIELATDNLQFLVLTDKYVIFRSKSWWESSDNDLSIIAGDLSCTGWPPYFILAKGTIADADGEPAEIEVRGFLNPYE